MLVLFISSLKLLISAAAMGFLYGIVNPSIYITASLWSAVGVALAVWLANTPWPWFIPLKILWVILLTLAIISLIIMIILLVVYGILANFVKEVLEETTPVAATSSDVNEDAVNDGNL